MGITVERQAKTFVATVRGVQVNRMSNAQRNDLHQAYLQHKVLLIPDQHLDAADVAKFSRMFGETVEHPVKNFLHPQYPEVMILSNSTRLGKPIGVRDAGSFWLWDHRCVMHKATTKQLPANMTRTLYRVSTLGTVPC